MKLIYIAKKLAPVEDQEQPTVKNSKNNADW